MEMESAPLVFSTLIRVELPDPSNTELELIGAEPSISAGPADYRDFTVMATANGSSYGVSYGNQGFQVVVQSGAVTLQGL
jgi:hypothetical protein